MINSFPIGFLRMLATTRHPSKDGRDRMDHPPNTIPAAQRRGGPRVRQAQVGDAGRSAHRGAGPLVRPPRGNHVPRPDCPLTVLRPGPQGSTRDRDQTRGPRGKPPRNKSQPVQARRPTRISRVKEIACLRRSRYPVSARSFNFVTSSTAFCK